MNKKEKFENLTNKKYTVKQAIAYYVISYIDTENKLDFKEVGRNLLLKLIRIDEKRILTMRDTEIVEKVDYHWILTAEQVIAYGYIIFNNFALAGQKMKLNDIVKEFESVAKLYSPNNAEEFLKREMDKREKGCGRCD